MAARERSASSGGPRKRRKSLADELAAKRTPAFKAELNASFNFRWPVLNEVDSGVVLLKLQDNPSLRSLAGRARQRSEATAAARAEAWERRKPPGADAAAPPPSKKRTSQSQPDLRTETRRASARRRDTARREAEADADPSDALPIVGLNAVGRALERGQLAAVVICRDAVLASVSTSATAATDRRAGTSSAAEAASMMAHLPAMCHRHGTALCCLARNIDTAQLGRTVGQRRCVAIGIPSARSDAETGAVEDEDDEEGSSELALLSGWLRKRCPAPKIGWLASADQAGDY